MKTALITILFMFGLSNPIFATDFFSAFAGMSLESDTQIEASPTNNKTTTLSPAKIGDIIHIQLFVPQGANRKTFGYDIEFVLVGKNFAQYLGTPSGRAWDGSQLLPSSGTLTISALLLSQPTIPANGYLGQVDIPVIQNIESGFILAIKSAAMGDTNSQRDLLNASGATITFSSIINPIDGDIDLDGDVDFSDFLTFTKNYGRNGPRPSTQGQITIISIHDTVRVVKHDTIYVTRRDTVRLTVRDTVYLSGSAPPSQPTIPTKGSNANAISSLDLVSIGGVVGNGTDDKIVQGTISGSRTRIVVEIFATGLTKGLTGVDVKFDIDTRILRVVSVTAPSTFPLVLPRTDSTATVGAFAPGFPPNGLLMTVTFETGPDVTGVKFSIGLKSLRIAVSPTDTDVLTSGRIFFNSSNDDSAPATPTAFAAVLRSATTIELRWSAPRNDSDGDPLTGLSKYVIYRAVSSVSAGFTNVATVDSTLRSYENSGLAFNTTYIYQIAAIDAQGNESPQSSSVTLTTATQGTSVAAPTNVMATYVGNATPPQVQLTWTPPAQFDSFLIERAILTPGASSNNLNFVIWQSAQVGTGYADKTIQSGTIYVYRVSTNLSGQKSDPSSTITITIP